MEKIVHYVKMTKNSTNVNARDVLPQDRDQLEEDTTSMLIWAVGQLASAKVTKTVKRNT